MLNSPKILFSLAFALLLTACDQSQSPSAETQTGTSAVDTAQTAASAAAAAADAADVEEATDTTDVADETDADAVEPATEDNAG